MQQRDYIERMIEQLAAMIAGALGVGGQGRVEEAQRDLDRAWMSTVGLRRGDAEHLDDASLKALLGAKVVLAAKLLEAESSLEEMRGRPARAETLRRRAVNLTK